MGLDSYWELPDDQPDIHFDPPINLCGGMFSGMGEGSFRGGFYTKIVEIITGQPLHQEKINNETICQMANDLEEALNSTHEEGEFGIPESEFSDLVRMFRAYADSSAELAGSW